MAKTQVPSGQGFGEIAKRMGTAGDGTGSCVKSCSGYSGTCTIAHVDSTFASPANGAGAIHIVGNGLELADADTVATSTTTETDDTVELDHVFTASGAETVTGFGIYNDDDDALFMECCLNAGVAMISGDTFTIEAKQQFKLGA